MVIRNIWCVGRNYKDHATEMKSEVPTTPLIFLKAGSSASVNSTLIELPHWVEEVHHEVELALRFSPHMDIIEGAVALDLTERKKQTEAKNKGLPWTLAKSFDGACPISASFQIRGLENLKNRTLKLWVNDELRQSGNIDQMIFGMPELVTHIHDTFPVCAGDYILTGTPAGVGPIQEGDKVKVEFQDAITHIWRVTRGKPPVKKDPFHIPGQ